MAMVRLTCKFADDMAIKALEKQIYKKPVIYLNTNRADCPVCGATHPGSPGAIRVKEDTLET